MSEGRIFLWDPRSLSGFTSEEYCRGAPSTAECYFIPPSNCTLADTNAGNSEVSKIGFFYMVPTPVWGFDARLATLGAPWTEPASANWWWPAQGAMYLARFNSATSKSVADRFLSYGALPRGTFSAHVRVEHLKAVEMALVPLDTFIDRAMAHAGEPVLRARASWSGCTAGGACVVDAVADRPVAADPCESGRRVLQKSLFLSTEDPVTVAEALNPTGRLRSAGWRVFALPVPRASQGSHRPATAINTWQAELWGAHVEMLNSLQNLAYSITCDAWICTSGSNWCLLVYEARSIWLRKGNHVYEEAGPAWTVGLF